MDELERRTLIDIGVTVILAILGIGASFLLGRKTAKKEDVESLHDEIKVLNRTVQTMGGTLIELRKSLPQKEVEPAAFSVQDFDAVAETTGSSGIIKALIAKGTSHSGGTAHLTIRDPAAYDVVRDQRPHAARIVQGSEAPSKPVADESLGSGAGACPRCGSPDVDYPFIQPSAGGGIEKVCRACGNRWTS